MEGGQKNKERLVVCPDCGSTDLAWRNGEQYCKHCGLVIE
ncbi:hypothetical protein KY318_02730 [Candidatus Woesearchaeota archaeon]|nr:hypothetical protein [Candidatus Woesearchaeota archaeon]